MVQYGYRVDAPRGICCYYENPEDGEESVAVSYVSGLYRVSYPGGELRERIAPWHDDYSVYWDDAGDTDGTYLFFGFGRMDLRDGSYVQTWDERGSWMVWNHADDRVYASDGETIKSFDPGGGGEQLHYTQAYPGAVGAPSKDDQGNVWWHSRNHWSNNQVSERRIFNLAPGTGELTFDDYAFYDPSDGWNDLPRHVLWYFDPEAAYLGTERGEHLFGGRCGHGTDYEGAIYRRNIGDTHEPGAGHIHQDPGLFELLANRTIYALNGGRSQADRKKRISGRNVTGATRFSRVDELNFNWTSLPNVKAKSHRIGKILGREQPGVKSGETVFDDVAQEWVTHDENGVPVYDSDGNRIVVGIPSEEAFGTPTIIREEIIRTQSILSGEAFGEPTVELKLQFIEAEGFADDPQPTLEGGQYGGIGYGGVGQNGDEDPSQFGNPTITQT